MRAIREGWSHWREAERREEDERERLVRLLAYCDAFFAVLIMLVGLLVVQPLLLSASREAPAVTATLSLFPLAAITAASLVFVVSWRLRNGGIGGRVALVKAGRMVAGLAAGYALVVGLSIIGLLPMDIQPSFLVGSAIGIAVATVLIVALSLRR